MKQFVLNTVLSTRKYDKYFKLLFMLIHFLKLKLEQRGKKLNKYCLRVALKTLIEVG